MLNLDQFEVLTFDCYGTLIDWETGIWEALRPVLAAHQVNLPAEQALELYGALESAAEAGEYQEYKTILQVVLEGFGAEAGLYPYSWRVKKLFDLCKRLAGFPRFTRRITGAAQKIQAGNRLEHRRRPVRIFARTAQGQVRLDHYRQAGALV